MYKPTSSHKKFIGLTVLAAVLSVLFVFLGTPILRVLRNVYGSAWYWGAGAFSAALLMAIGMGPMGFLVAAVWMSIGIYSEFEERGHAGIPACLTSLSAATAVLIGGSLAWFWAHGIDFNQELKTGLASLLAQVTDATVGENSKALRYLNMDVETLIRQSPSLIFITLMMGLAFALIFDRKTAFMSGLPFERVASQMRLLEFRLPDVLLWVTMASMLLAFVNKVPAPIANISMNIFNILVAGYFFQGIAILEVAFVTYRIGSLVRLFTYIFIVGQLFLLLSAVGFIDYWIDFRRRMRIARISENNRKNGEQV